MNNAEKMEEMLNENPELGQKISAEADRLMESEEVGDPKEAIAKAVKAVLSIDLTQEELDAMLEESGELDLDDLDQIAGGNIFDDAMRKVANMTTTIMLDLIQKNEIDNMRVSNSTKIIRAARENGVESKYKWIRGVGWVKIY